MVTYTLTEANRRTAELVNEARYGRQPVMITDHGKPAAVVISPELLERYQALEDAADLRTIEQLRTAEPQWIGADEANRLMDDLEAEIDGKAR